MSGRIVQDPFLGPQPAHIQCPLCHRYVITEVRYEPMCLKHASACVLLCIMVKLGPIPHPVVCDICNCPIMTVVKRQCNAKTHLLAILLCYAGCWPCVCLPYCMDSCQNANHYCPNCNAYIGTYQN